MVAQNDQAWNRSITLLREALAIYRTADAVAGQATASFWLGRALLSSWDSEHRDDHIAEAMQCFDESLGVATQLGDWIGAGWCRIWLSSQAFWNEDLDTSEQLAKQVVEECTAAGVRHPVGQALCILAYIAHRRDEDDAALEFLHEAVALYRDLGDRFQLAGLLVDLAVQEAVMGRGDEALETLAESSRLDEQIGRPQTPGRVFKLAAAAAIYVARGERAQSISALGAYLEYSPEGNRKPYSRFGGYIRGLIDITDTMIAQFDSIEVAAARAAARRKNVDALIEEFIIEPATAATL
jgi:tetratricopeptide (TPR) repeat protein